MYTSRWTFRWINAITIFSLLVSLAPVQTQASSSISPDAVRSSSALPPPAISDGWAAARLTSGEVEVTDRPPAMDVLPRWWTAVFDEDSSQPIEKPTSDTASQVETTLPSSPLMFIKNVGQFAEDARFQVRGGGRTMWLAEDGLWVTVMKPTSPTLALSPHLPDRERERENTPGRGVHLKLSFPGANSHPRLEPFNRLDTHISYFTGDDPAQWHTDVPVWGGVRYVELYPGVDLEVTGEEGRWTWRLVNRRSPFAVRHSDIRLRVDGADTLALDDADRLRLTTAVGDFALPLLQTVAASRTTVEQTTTQPEINGLEVASPFATDVPHLALQEQAGAEPLSSQSNSSDLLYGTFLGGDDSDYGRSIAVDKEGNAYVTGETYSSGFPTTTGAFDPAYNGEHDAFVVKLNADGTDLVYAAFLGGEDDDSGLGITVDETGNAYVTGGTESGDFPTTQGAFDQVHGPHYCSANGHPILCLDAFVVKVNADGTSLEYATFLGGNDDDWNDVGQAIAVDEAGNVYVTGETESDDFPTQEAYDATYNDWSDAFMVKLDLAGNGQADLLYATFLGGSNDDYGYSIAVDEAGNAYVAGETWSSDFPTKDAYDTDCGGCHDAFVVKLDPASSGEDSLLYATFLGGEDSDCGYGIAVDEADNAYVTGETQSSDFPTTTHAFDTSYNDEYNGGFDAFMVKLDLAGNGDNDLRYATFLGGGSGDYGTGITVDEAGNAYVTGYTWSSNFPTTTHAFSTTKSGEVDAFVVKLSPAGNGDNDLRYATFLGGDGDDYGYAITVDNAGNAYVTGWTDSTDFPTTTHAFDPSYNGGYWDAFVTAIRISPLIDVSVSTHTLTLNEEGWPSPNPLVVTVTVNNVTTSTMPNATVFFTITSLADQARFLVLTEEELARADQDKVFSRGEWGPLLLEFGSLDPYESASIVLPLWVQPSNVDILTLHATLTAGLGEEWATVIGASDREEVAIPTAEIHPVVFMHGILGSMPPKNSVITRWPQNLKTPMASFTEGYLDPWLDSYSPLIENLMKMGYELEKTLFPITYDWRKSNRDSGAWLGEALAGTVIPSSQNVSYVNHDDNQADVVVHSMGGLVTRAYVQGLATNRPYQGDVNKVIFIATPHRGFPVTYRTWEGLTWEEYLGREVDPESNLVLPFQAFGYFSLRQLMDELLWPYFILKRYRPEAGQPCWYLTIPMGGLLEMLWRHWEDPYLCPLSTLQEYSHSTDPDHPGIGSLPEMLPPVSDGDYPEAASRPIPPYLYDSGGSYPYGYQVNPLLEKEGLNAPGVQATLDAALGLDNIYVIYGDGVETAVQYEVESQEDDSELPWPNGFAPARDWREYPKEGDDLIPTYSTRLRDSEPGQPGQGLLPNLPEENEIGIAGAEHKGIVYHEYAQRAVGFILTGNGNVIDDFPLHTNYNSANFFFNNGDVIVVIVFWSPVDGMVTDPSGQRVGYDPDTDQIVNEIPGAYYSGNTGELEFFLLPGGFEGDYTVTASGTGSGDYLVTMYRADTSGARLTSAITGTASVGEVVTGTVAYTVPTTSLFFDDLESGGGDWLAEGSWSLITDTAHSPVVAWAGETVTPGIPLTLTLQPSLDLSTTRMARLTFWHSYTLSSEAQARVELSTDGGVTWGTLSARHGANGWMPVEIDLTPFTGPDYAPLRLRFRLLPARAGDRWRIDDVGVEDLETPWLFALPFEDDVEGWRRWDGTGDWVVVTGTVHGGQHGWVATQEGSTLVLVGPLDLRETVSPTLNFWYTMTANGAGLVEVSTDGAIWQPAATVTETTNWTQAEVDLSEWAGLTPTLRLRHAGQAGSGWAVDDFLARNVVPPVMHALPFIDDMETPGNWQPFGGWETVTETAHSDTTAWHGTASDSALVLVDRLGLTNTASPMLTFWQQFALPKGSIGYVKATTDDGLTWQPVLTITDPIPGWTQVQVNLSDYAGQEIGLKFYLDEVVTSSMASGVRPIASSRQEVYRPTNHQGEDKQTVTPGVMFLPPLTLAVLCCGMVLTTEKRGRRRVFVLLAILGMSSVMLACGRMSDERRYARINKLTDVLGEVELIVGAERQPSYALLSPGGKWLAVELGPDHTDWLFVNLATGDIKKLEQPIRGVQWINDEYCAARYSTKSYLIHLPDLAVTRLVQTDTIETIKGAEDVYVLWRLGARNENAVLTTDPEFPYIVLDYFTQEEIEQRLGNTLYEIVSWDTYIDPTERVYAPHGRYYLYAIGGRRTAIYDAQTDEEVAHAYKRLWNHQELGWAYDSSGVYVIYFGATVDEGAANPYHPIYKWLVPGATPRGTPALSTDSGQAPAGESRVPGNGQLLLVSHLPAPAAEEVAAGWYVDDVVVRDLHLPADQTYAPCEYPIGCTTHHTNWAGDAISTRMGNYHYNQQDFSIPVLGDPLRFERSYNNQTIGLYTTSMGHGWTHNYAMGLTFPDNPDGKASTVIVEGYRGSRFRFMDNGDGTHEPFPGVWATLTRTLTLPYTYTLTGVDQSAYVFDDAGRLAEMCTPWGHAVTLVYSGTRLARVEDATGERFLAFEYDDDGRLVEVRDPISRTVRYGYDADTGDLVVVTDTLTHTWTYVYTGALSWPKSSSVPKPAPMD